VFYVLVAFRLFKQKDSDGCTEEGHPACKIYNLGDIVLQRLSWRFFKLATSSKPRKTIEIAVNTVHLGCYARYTLVFLGRLPKVDLIILEGGNVRPYVRPYVCPSVRPSTKSFFDFNEIWYIGRGR